MIHQRRSQNPYDFSNNSNRRSSLYDFSLHDYHQQATGSSFAVQPGKFPNEIDRDEFSF